MSQEYGLLALNAPVGIGQENRPEYVAALDDKLRITGEYIPPPEYADGPQRYATEPMINVVGQFQGKNGLKVDGIVNPGGPTERAINNRLQGKPRGVGLMLDPPTALGGKVGNGLENFWDDVVSVKRQLGALDYGLEHPFDRPNGFIDEVTTDNVKAFQRAKGLSVDGWLAPGGETERALNEEVADMARAEGRTWAEFAVRSPRAHPSFGTMLEQLDRRRTRDGAAHESLEYRPNSEDEFGVLPVQSRLPNTSLPKGPGPLPPFHPGGTEEIPGSPRATFRLLLESIPRGGKYGLLPRQSRRSEGLPVDRSHDFQPSLPRKGAELVPYRTETLAKNAEGIVVEHRGSQAVQDYDAELARQIWRYSASISLATNCTIIHEAGARAVVDMTDTRTGQRIKAGENVSQRKVDPRDKSGNSVKQSFGHSFPDMAFYAIPTKRRLFINSYTPNASGNPNAWERFSSFQLQQNAETGDIVLLVPKLRPNEVLDATKFQAIVYPLLMDICFPFKPGTGDSRVPMYVERDVKRPKP